MTVAAVAPVRAANLCEVTGCDRHVEYVVVRDGLHMNVCRKCGPEMVAVAGWRVER